MKRIDKIIVHIKHPTVYEFEELGSFPGGYSDTPREGAIDRKERGSWKPGEPQYFNPTNFDREFPEFTELDYKAMEGLHKGEYSLIAMLAEARPQVSLDGGNHWGPPAYIISKGYSGIESNSDKESLERIAEGQVADLRLILKEFGFSVEEGIDQIPEYHDPETIDFGCSCY